MKCRLCRGRCFLLGVLGMLRWYRCRDCGYEYCKESKARWRR